MHKAYFCLFCEKICHQFRETNAHSDFFFYYQILQALPNLKGAGILLRSRTNFRQA